MWILAEGNRKKCQFCLKKSSSIKATSIFLWWNKELFLYVFFSFCLPLYGSKRLKCSLCCFHRFFAILTYLLVEICSSICFSSAILILLLLAPCWDGRKIHFLAFTFQWIFISERKQKKSWLSFANHSLSYQLLFSTRNWQSPKTLAITFFNQFMASKAARRLRHKRLLTMREHERKKPLLSSENNERKRIKETVDNDWHFIGIFEDQS